MAAATSESATIKNDGARLSLTEAALYTLVMNIGLRWLPVAAAVGPASLPLWVLALFTFFVPLAAATGVLTARFQGEGGIYLWTRDSIGPLAGFLCGWFYWFALMPYFAGILYFLAQILMSAFGLDTKDTTLYLAFAVGLSVLVTALQFGGLHLVKWIPNIGTIASWFIFLMIAGIACVVALHGQSATNFGHSSYMPPLTFDTAILWGTIVFAFSGVEGVALLRNDLKGGMQTVLRVLAIVGIAIAVVYIVGTAAMLVILPSSAMTRLGGFTDALRAVFDRAHVGAFVPVALVLFAFSQTGGLTSWFAAGARLPLAAGVDNLLPAIFARRHPTTGAPVAAIWLQGALMIVFVILGQAGATAAAAYDFLVNMSILTNTLCYAFMFAAYFKLARSEVQPGDWRAPGGVTMNVVLATMGQITTWIAIICTLVPSGSDPHPLMTFLKISGSAAAMVVIGLLLYYGTEFVAAISSCFSKYIDFNGRARRQEYWLWQLFIVLVLGLGGNLELLLGGPRGPLSLLQFISALATLAFILATFLPSLSVLVRRLHDINCSGWFVLLAAVPLLGPLALFIMTLLPGTNQSNSYGPQIRG